MMKQMELFDGKNSRKSSKINPKLSTSRAVEPDKSSLIRTRSVLQPIGMNQPDPVFKYKRGTGPEAEAKMKKVRKRCAIKVLFRSQWLLAQW